MVTYLVAAILVLVGCQRGPDLPPMAEVTGTVTLDGRPLPRGTVQFVPDPSQGSEGPPAVGTIAEDGAYELTTAGVDGAIVGTHKVRVISQELPKDETDTFPPSLIPSRYNNEQTSGFVVEVKEGTTNSIDLPLSSAE
jgi:hypothetical protein